MGYMASTIDGESVEVISKSIENGVELFTDADGIKYTRNLGAANKGLKPVEAAPSPLDFPANDEGADAYRQAVEEAEAVEGEQEVVELTAAAEEDDTLDAA